MRQQWTTGGRRVQSLIKSIQRGTRASAGTVTISGVDTNSAAVRVQLPEGVSAGTNFDFTVTLTNSTTLTFTMASAISLRWEVVEFWPSVVEYMQSGTVSVGVGVVTATLTVPYAPRAFVFFRGQTNVNTQTLPSLLNAWQDSDTAIRVSRDNNGDYGYTANYSIIGTRL